jgi:hypothetical protein
MHQLVLLNILSFRSFFFIGEVQNLSKFYQESIFTYMLTYQHAFKEVPILPLCIFMRVKPIERWRSFKNKKSQIKTFYLVNLWFFFNPS